MLPRPHCRLVLIGAAVASLVALSGYAWGQLSVTAEVDRDSLTLDELVQLTVTVAGSTLSRLEEPTLPELDGLRVIGTSTQQSFSLVNGRMQSSYSFVYTLQPTRTGKLVIPSIAVTAKGRTYRTAPLTVDVSAGTGRTPARTHGTGPGVPAPGDPFAPGPMSTLSSEDAVAVRHRAEPRTAYVGQQVTYEFVFYQAEQLAGDVSYREAETPGFVAEALPNPPPADEELNGRTYRTQRRRKALFATSPGRHTIGQAVVTVLTDPFAAPRELVAEPISVNVLPLPEAGRPPDFTGAVGTFRVSLSVGQQQVRAGETISVQVQVTGTGNIKSLGAPKLVLPSSARLYEAGENRRVEPGGGGEIGKIGGTAVFSYLVLPREAGNLQLGPVRLPYFDPSTRTYRVAQSNAVSVEVGPGLVSPVEGSQANGGLKPIRSTAGRLVGEPIALQTWFWGALALPLLPLAWAGWRRWQTLAVDADPGSARARRALQLARARLAEARRCAERGDCDGCYAQMHAAVCDYVADRLGGPPGGLTAESVYHLLHASGCPQDLAARTRTLLERAAAGRFAPGGGEPDQAVALAIQGEELVRTLQKEVPATRGGE